MLVCVLLGVWSAERLRLRLAVAVAPSGSHCARGKQVERTELPLPLLLPLRDRRLLLARASRCAYLIGHAAQVVVCVLLGSLTFEGAAACRARGVPESCSGAPGGE